MLNPIFASTASVLSCNGGLAALALNYSGIDPRGYMIRVIVWVLGLFKELIIWISEFSLIAFECSGIVKIFVAGVLLYFLTTVMTHRIKIYLLERGIHQGK